MKSECGRDPCLCTSSAHAIFVALDICLCTILQTSKKKVSNRFYSVPNILLYAISLFTRIVENSGGCLKSMREEMGRKEVREERTEGVEIAPVESDRRVEEKELGI